MFHERKHEAQKLLRAMNCIEMYWYKHHRFIHSMQSQAGGLQRDRGASLPTGRRNYVDVSVQDVQYVRTDLVSFVIIKSFEPHCKHFHGRVCRKKHVESK